MADWRQIQARIRKAKNAPDAHAKLSELFQRTRDAMVAWELALLEEKALVQTEAVKWYTIAAQRFRRAEWKKKAEEALTRLGAELPVAGTEAARGEEHPAAVHADAQEGDEQHGQLAVGEIPEESAAAHDGDESAPATAGGIAADALKKKRRRGRRGGRGRRRKSPGDATGLPNQAFAETSTPAHRQPQGQPQAASAPQHEPPRQQTFDRPAPTPREVPEPHRPTRVEAPMLQLPSERAAHGRAGDPALASRMTVLESTLRRLLSSPLHKLEQADEAPAGPGVFLLSDSDQTTSYYIEACQTLRIGLGNLARGGSRAGKSPRAGGRGGYSESGLKSKLAEHLGISETKVSQYLKDHCVVRWIQLDDDAPLLAHFAVALLRTPLNLD
jgi:hypothetical protein